MKVSELIAELSKLDGDRIMVLSRDEEGNGYNELTTVDANCKYDDGDLGIEILTPELKEQGFSKEDVMYDGVPAVCLCP